MMLPSALETAMYKPAFLALAALVLDATASPADRPFVAHQLGTVPGQYYDFSASATGYSVFLPDASILHVNFEDQVVARDADSDPASEPPRAERRRLLAPSVNRLWQRAEQGGFWNDDEIRPEVGLASVCSRRQLVTGEALMYLQHGIDGNLYGDPVGHDGAGGAWVLFDEGTVARMAADCRTDRIIKVDEPMVRLHADPTSIAAYAIGTRSRDVYRFSMGGLDWRRSLPRAPQGTSEPKLVVLNSGDLVIHYSPADTPAPFQDLVLSYDANGEIRWEYFREIGVSAMGPLGDGYYFAGNDGLAGHDASGQRLWRSTMPAHLNISQGSIERDPQQGLAWVIGSVTTDQGTLYRASLISGSGVVAQSDLPGQLNQASVLADGSLLLGRRSVFLQDHLYRLRPGEVLRTLSFQTPNPARTWAHLADDSGSITLIRDSFTQWSLHAADEQQAALWKRQGNTAEVSSFTPQLAANEQALCLLLRDDTLPQGAATHRLSCYRRHDGEALWPELSFTAFGPQLHLRPSGEVEVFHWDYLPSFVVRRSQVTAEGQMVDPILPLYSPPDFNFDHILSVTHFQNGKLLLRLALLDGELEAHALLNEDDGSLISERVLDRPWEPATSRAFEANQAVAEAAEQYAVLGWRSSEFGSGEPWVRSYDYAGDLLWERRIEATQSFARKLALISSADGWMVIALDQGVLGMWVLRREDGTISAERRLPYHDPLTENGFASTFLKRGIDRFALLTPLPGALRSQWFDGTDGSLLATATAAANRPLLAPSFRDQQTRDRDLRANGSADLAATGSGCCFPAAGIARVDLSSRFPDRDASPADLDGAWFDPQLTGQGIFVESYPDSNQLYAGLFTYTDSVSGQASELRWYSLQGSLPGPDGIAQLTIYRNANGRFLQGPATTAQAMGTARLWPTAAAGMQLELQFDDGSPIIGMDLVRALPTAGTGSRLWYESELSGQGLLLANPVAPGTLAFGAWFTYDPEGAADDPHAQLWLTIQADAPGDQVHALTIYRTTGGRLGTLPSGGTDAIGTGSLRKLDCAQLEFNYQFDQSDLAGDLAGLAGQRILQPLAGCTDQ